MRQQARFSRKLASGFAWTLLCGGVACAFPTMLARRGLPDFVYGSEVEAGGGPATAYKPESKLFYTPDNRWWAVLGAGSGVYLYELDGTHVWQARLQLPAADPWEKADTLFDGVMLHVALRDNLSITGNRRSSKLYQLAYLGNGEWTPPSGPTPITTANLETLTIAADSTGRLWTAFEVGGRINIGFTEPFGTAFTFTILPTLPLTSDDIAAVTAFGTDSEGRKVGVMWSDEAGKVMSFAWRHDADPIDAPWHTETAYGAGVGGCTGRCADDHINLKVHGDEFYAVVKTNLDVNATDPTAPLNVLLRRDPAGVWSAFPVSPVAQHASRPILLLAPDLDRIWVFAKRGSNVYVWESLLSAPGFNPDGAVLWTRSIGWKTSDPTSTKQIITKASGAVVETSVSATYEYWHNEFLP